MVLLRMLAFLPDAAQSRTVAVATPKREKVPDTVTPKPDKRDTGSGQDASGDWESMIATMNLKGMVRQLAENCSLTKRDASHVQLSLDPAHIQLRNDNLEQRLQQALSSE